MRTRIETLVKKVNRIAYRWGRFVAKGVTIALSQSARLIPIEPNRIVCISHIQGLQCADSPMCITQYLLDHYKGDFEICWLVKDPRRFKELEDKGIRLVKFKTLSDFYYSNTAQVFISNLFGPPPWVVKRKNKMIVETTHGVAYKSLRSSKVSSFEVGFPEIKSASWKINGATLCLSGNRICSEDVYRNELGYRGEILEEGLPRNDVFFTDGRKQDARVRECFSLDDECRIVLMMPTWRKDHSRENIEIDYHALVHALEELYGGKWTVLLRLHHLSKVDISDIMDTYSDCVLNATDYPAVQDLLCAGDLLITDYSSVMWDFALRERPILIFAPDGEEYRQGRGFNVPPEEWGLVTSSTQSELLDGIRSHSYEELCEASRAHLKRFGSCETGHATEAVCKRIASFCRTED